MKRNCIFSSLIVSALLSGAHAADGRPPIDIMNFLRIEQDDNVFTTGKDSAVGKQESFKIIEQIDLLLDTEQGASYFGIRYSPSFTWFDNRPDDSTDLAHQLDFSLRQKLTPRSNLYVKDTLRMAEEPELVQNDVVVRNNNDFLFNSLNVSYDNQVVPDKTTLRLDGRYAIMRYDDSAVADDNDYDQLTFGTDVVQRLAPNADGGLQVRYTDLSYDDSIRDTESIQAGGIYTRILNPRLQTDVRLGWENRSSDYAVEEKANSPYADLNLVYVPVRDTTATLGVGYAYDKSPVSTFAQQTRSSIRGDLAQKLSPAVTVNLSGAYFVGNFDLDDATSRFDPAIHTDGDETTFQFGLRLSYQINIRNWVEASYQYTELDSDVRPGDDFDRNRISLGWKYSL